MTLALSLIKYLETSNYVPFRGIWRAGHTDETVRRMLAEAKMVLYSPTREVYVPDEGTLAWVCWQKFGA